MSVNPSASGLGGIGLASEYQRASDTVSSNNTEDTNVVNTKTNVATQNNQTNSSVEEQPINEPLSSAQLDKVAQQLQDFVGDLNRNIKFLVDEDSGRNVIKVIDKNSGDLIKQYPSEEVLTLVSKLSDMVGGFIDAKV